MQPHGALAPVWRIADTVRIATTAVFVNVELLQPLEERPGNVTCAIPRFSGLKPGGDTFDHCLLAFHEMSWWLTEIDGPRQRAMVKLVLAAITSLARKSIGWRSRDYT
ncbi:hypothetical protein D3C79_970680 [compost metagenome]